MISIAIFLLFVGLFTAPAHSQTHYLDCPVQEMNYTACAGDEVTFTCGTTTPEVLWQIYDANGIVASSYYDSMNNIGDTQGNGIFSFNKTGNYTFTVSFIADYDLNYYWVNCTDVVIWKNYTTNVTTFANTTESCSIKIPGMPVAPTTPTYFLGNNPVNVWINWTYPSNPSQCVTMFLVQAKGNNGLSVNKTVDSMVTITFLPLDTDVQYTITVTAQSIAADAESGSICIQLTSPSAVTNLLGVYREPQQDIRATWNKPIDNYCKRPNVTSYNVTHNVTDDGSGEGASGSGANMDSGVSANETLTLPANVTWVTLTDVVYGNIYFVEVVPSNTFGFGATRVVWITATTTTTTTSTSTSTPSATATESPTSAGGLSTGAIVGIVVGSIVGVILVVVVIVVIVVIIWRSKKDDDDGLELKEGTKL